MTKDAKFALTAGALLAAAGVAAGAFGAHGLRDMLDSVRLGWWQTAVQYQMWQAIALVAIGASGLAGARWSARLLTFGTLVFAGTLYAMALGGPRWLGAVTPLGGAAIIAGWLCLAWSALRTRTTES